MKKEKEKETEKKTETRKITKYLKQRGIDIVLKECGNNLRCFKNHIRSTCHLDKRTKLYPLICEAKEILKNRLLEYQDVKIAVEKLLQENFGENEIIF